MAEQTLWTGSPSQVKNLPSFLLAALFAGGILFATLVLWNWPPGVGFIGIPVIYAVCRWMAVSTEQFQLTTERLLTSHGVFSRTTDSLELYRVKDLRILQPFRLRLCGLENIELTTSDHTTPTVVIDHIPSSLHLASQVREQVEACRQAKGTREVELE